MAVMYRTRSHHAEKSDEVLFYPNGYKNK